MSQDRFLFATALVKRAGAFAHEYFLRLDTLNIESKGHQDMVSEADRDTEVLVRDAIAQAFPDDGIIGEEHGAKEGSSEYTWIIDPIDGTANFVAGIPQWCVIIACVKNDEKHIGVIYDPCADELFAAQKGKGATLNGKSMSASNSASISDGSIGLGFSARSQKQRVIKAVEMLLDEGGIFFRNASGGLMLAYAASGRLIGYIEDHMHPWDCMAGLLLVEEAGGICQPIDVQDAVMNGCKVVTGGPKVFDKIKALTDKAYV
ncbi:Inositol-1-monophosphatase [Pseudovibrio axinellae]|uniref:Inositol-1-monophosphatase n=1 Tax=Pseudovibrio axinellae TaxID=989403 RepID=A0A165UKU1_9HYPH|nr:inositol monophosphatase family protein [Pseudovibrio axinellae]KZL12480.1 Inositol-1-monophosphatase [Pseudovibrio axinellae]SEP70389.1 myo-inositol-1(or 4)-monophosphatase [Pseudovibrio axinellae]